jgi:hypothetical protein
VIRRVQRIPVCCCCLRHISPIRPNGER